MFREACVVGGCSESQARLLCLGVRIRAWSSSAKLAEPLPSRRKLRFRLPGKKSDAELRIVAKHAEGAGRLAALGTSPTMAQVEAVIARVLAA